MSGQATAMTWIKNAIGSKEKKLRSNQELWGENLLAYALKKKAGN